MNAVIPSVSPSRSSGSFGQWKAFLLIVPCGCSDTYIRCASRFVRSDEESRISLCARHRESSLVQHGIYVYCREAQNDRSKHACTRTRVYVTKNTLTVSVLSFEERITLFRCFWMAKRNILSRRADGSELPRIEPRSTRCPNSYTVRQTRSVGQ